MFGDYLNSHLVQELDVLRVPASTFCFKISLYFIIFTILGETFVQGDFVSVLNK